MEGGDEVGGGVGGEGGCGPSLWIRTVEGVVLLPLARCGATVRVTDEKRR